MERKKGVSKPGEVEGDERRPGRSYTASLLLNQVREPL